MICAWPYRCRLSQSSQTAISGDIGECQDTLVTASVSDLLIRISKPLQPLFVAVSLSTRSTRASAGARFLIRSIKVSTASLESSACIRTESVAFTAQPAIPSSEAIRLRKGLKPTPCTRPNTRIVRASFAAAHLLLSNRQNENRCLVDF